MHIDALTVTDLTRSFGTVKANDGISLRVRSGEVVGLLGHNGAGKTTLVSQVVGLLKPNAGSIRVNGIDAIADPAAARRNAALQPQAQPPIDGLSVRGAIEIAARIRGLTKRQARAAAEALANELDIEPWLDRRALPDGRGLSGGIRRLAAFAMTVVAPTPLLVFDEPTNDVDAARRRLLWAAVRRRADAGAGVLLVTHNVTEAERIVDELVVLDRGSVVAAGSPAALRGTQDSDLRLELQLPPNGGDPSADENALPVTPLRRTRAGRRVLITVSAADAAPAVTWASELREGAIIDGYTLGPATLEDAYFALTSPAHPDEADAIDSEERTNA